MVKFLLLMLVILIICGVFKLGVKQVGEAMSKIYKLIENKHKREQQINKCQGCVWGQKQEGVIVCPFSECMKSGCNKWRQIMNMTICAISVKE